MNSLLHTRISQILVIDSVKKVRDLRVPVINYPGGEVINSELEAWSDGARPECGDACLLEVGGRRWSVEVVGVEDLPVSSGESSLTKITLFSHERYPERA